MSIQEAIDVLLNEMRCVSRADGCDRQCQNCDLVRQEQEILDAYTMAIGALEICKLPGMVLGVDDE